MRPILFFLLFLSLCTQAQKSPYLTKILAYKPAPGQFIDVKSYVTSGESTEAVNTQMVLDKLTERLAGKAGKSFVSLGAYGGYIVVGFDHPICNVKGDYDFKVYGNATYTPGFFPGSASGIGGSCEPGIVMVSKDVNGNGLPDDEWYELAGSEYNHPQTIQNYEITYYKPNPLNGNILWKDNQGNQDSVYRNSFHLQASYYPTWIKEDSLVFKGNRLPDNAVNMADSVGFEDKGDEFWVLKAFDWGYADNHANTREEAKFKIDWAVDAFGNSVDLDFIDFIKVYTGVNQSAGYTGEVSTEFAGIEDLHPPKDLTNSILKNERRLAAYPNPCRGTLYVEALCAQTACLLSPCGKIQRVFELKKGVNTLDLQNVCSGFYILKTEQENIKILLLGIDK